MVIVSEAEQSRNKWIYNASRTYESDSVVLQATIILHICINDKQKKRHGYSLVYILTKEYLLHNLNYLAPRV